MTATCTSCHATPPTTRSAELANAADTYGVGNHVAHAKTPTIFTTAYACTQCHPNQTAMNHATGTVELVFADPAMATTFVTGSCRTSYCHGDATVTAAIYKYPEHEHGPATRTQTTWGGLLKQPLWNDAGDTYKGVHGVPRRASHGCIGGSPVEPEVRRLPPGRRYPDHGDADRHRGGLRAAHEPRRRARGRAPHRLHRLPR